MMDRALRYASLGWYVFPIKQKAKTPLTAAGFRDASDDLEQVRRWWTKWRTANIGVACGASRLVVVDVDLPHGPDTVRSLRHELPATLTQRTGSGGTQFIYKAPTWTLRNTSGRLPGAGKTLGVDLRADGGYVVVPPSVHPSGEEYRWVHNVWPAPCPEWLREPDRTTRPNVVPLIPPNSKYGRAALDDEARRVRHALTGTRNNTLNEAAFSLGQIVAAGALTELEVTEHLRAAAMEAGLTQQEADQTITSGLAAGQEHPRRIGEG